jgi:hypothetical protein
MCAMCKDDVRNGIQNGWWLCHSWETRSWKDFSCWFPNCLKCGKEAVMQWQRWGKKHDRVCTFRCKVPFSFVRVTNPSCCSSCLPPLLYMMGIINFMLFRGTWLAGPCAISMLFPISLQLVHCCEDVFLTFLLDKFVKCSTLCSGVLSHVLMQGQ